MSPQKGIDFHFVLLFRVRTGVQLSSSLHVGAETVSPANVFNSMKLFPVIYTCSCCNASDTQPTTYYILTSSR